MKLVRYGRAGAEKPGVIDAEGKLRDLSRVVKDITPDVLTPAGLRRLRAVKPARLPLVKGKPRLGCPLAGIGKIVCIGLNYTDHAEEVGLPLPKEPTIFIKANSAISGPHDPIARPEDAVKLDYEVELVAVLGQEALGIGEAEALRHVAAYCLMNDVSERAFQMEHGGGTTKGKSADTFAPIGPWLVTADEVADPQGSRSGRRSTASAVRAVTPSTWSSRSASSSPMSAASCRSGRAISSPPALRPESAMAPSHRAISSRATWWRWGSTAWEPSVMS